MNRTLIVFYVFFFLYTPTCLQADKHYSANTISAQAISHVQPVSAAKLGIDTITKDFKRPKSFLKIDVAKKYGIKADGVTDNTYELLRLNQDCAGADKPFYSFTFPPGEILYADNTWLHGIDSFEVVGAGTSFRCTAKSPWSVAKQFFYNGGMLSNNPQKLGQEDHPEGHKFKSVNSGAFVLSLQNAKDVDNYHSGDRIYIAGYEEQMWGWPPNPRFFEWHTIKQINKAEGTIQLSAPLKFSYSNAWKDVAKMFDDGQLFGKPRIYKINNYTSYARFSDCYLLKNTNLTKDETPSFFFAAETLICDNLTIQGYTWPSENRYARYTNCKIISAEPDKNCGTVEFINCKFDGGLFGATGIDSLRLIGNTFGNYSPISPRILYAEGNKFMTKTLGASSLYGFFEFTHTDKVYLKNNSFSSTVKGDFVHVNYSDRHEFIAKDATNSTLILEDDNDPHSALARPMKNIGFGALIKSKDGKSSAIVKDIIHDGKNWVIQLEKVKGNPAKGQVWIYQQTDKIYDLGGNRATDGRKLWK